tara:strand:- start:1761 stop:2354 length:594 start_codon:yes stop_codon:yes gene_type:complete
MYNTTDNANLSFHGHVLISDADTGEVLLDKFNAINFENMAIAIANLLANQTDANGNGFYISKIAFGRGGTIVDANGNITYKTPKTNGSQGSLYEPNFGANADQVVEKAVGSFEISESAGQTFRDLTSVVTLDYSEPAEALASDNASNFDDAQSYVFDELALVGDNDALLTHLIFHPIQKSLNRKLEIRYTLRITAGN